LEFSFAKRVVVSYRRDFLDIGDFMRKLSSLCSLVFFLSCLTILSSCRSDQAKQQAQSESIRLGSVLALSGAQASFGQSTRKGIELALKEINDQGGILGKKITVNFFDNQSKPEESATVLTRIITQDKVVAILGDTASSNSLAMAPVAQRYKIPFVSPSSTNPRVTQVGDYIFRVCFIDPFQGEVMAKFAAESLKLNKIAVLRDIKSDYSVGLADFFKNTFTGLGGDIVADLSYAEGDVDFKSQLTAIKSLNPEAIFVPGYYNEAGLIARQARELGMSLPLLGGDGWDSTKLTEIGGSALEGSYFSNHYSPEDPTPEGRRFIETYKVMFPNEIPDGLSVTGYEAMLILGDAIRRAGSTEASKIRDALASTRNFAAPSGLISINEHRDAFKPAVVLEIKQGRFAFKEKINP
jgi:branched-chain amino acid transport system substrate-binding protein